MSEEEQNIVFIGKKSTMSYVLKVVSLMNSGTDRCYIKARGRSISKAVDVAEITVRKFLTNAVDIEDVKIGSQEVPALPRRNTTTEEPNSSLTKTVSTIEIVIRKLS